LKPLQLAELVQERIGGLLSFVFLGTLLLSNLIDDFKIDEGVNLICQYPVIRITIPLVFGPLLLELLLVDDQLLEGDEVKLRTGELRMLLARAVLAGIYFKFVDNCFILVP
jgi:hypothetical protein